MSLARREAAIARTTEIRALPGSLKKQTLGILARTFFFLVVG